MIAACRPLIGHLESPRLQRPETALMKGLHVRIASIRSPWTSVSRMSRPPQR
jgi:hypothetical protein